MVCTQIDIPGNEDRDSVIPILAYGIIGIILLIVIIKG